MIAKKHKKAVSLILSKRELTILSHALKTVVKRTDDWEFPIRMGVSVKEAETIIERVDKFSQENKMEMNVDLSESEGLVFHNALNEVCHGIDVPEFEEKIGGSKIEAKELMDELRKAL